MPFGGSITLGKHVPLIILSYNQGVKTGIFASFISCIINLILSFKIIPVKNFYSFLAIILLEYFLPNILLGFTPMFGYGIKNKNLKISVSVLVVFVLKIMISSIAGVIFWREYIPKEFEIWSYCIIYNSLYLVPEYLITLFFLKRTLVYSQFFKHLNKLFKKG